MPSKKTDYLVVASKVKEYLKEKGYQTSGELVETLDVHVRELVDRAIERTEVNGRKTVRGSDL